MIARRRKKKGKKEWESYDKSNPMRTYAEQFDRTVF
jgi:hypothetical protein